NTLDLSLDVGGELDDEPSRPSSGDASDAVHDHETGAGPAGSLVAHAGEQLTPEVLGLSDALSGQRGADRWFLRADEGPGPAWLAPMHIVVQWFREICQCSKQQGKNPVGCRLQHPAPPGDLRQ